MSTSGINYLISTNFLTDSGNFKIFYDFNSYSGSNNNYYVNSIMSGNPLYSGQIFYSNENIHTKQSINLINDDSRDIYITKTGEINLISHRINETGFSNSYIKINNSENLYNNNEFTFIFEGGKLSRNFAKDIYDYSGFSDIKPIHSKEIIFSNIIGSGNNYSGWEFGLNGANLLYFRTSDDESEKILTYDKDNPASENIWAVSYKNKNIYINKFDPNEEKIIGSNYTLISNLKNGSSWYIGSGNNHNLYSYDTGISNNYTSSIKLNNFLFFSEFLTEDRILEVSKTLKSNLNKNITSTFVITGHTINESLNYFETSGLLATVSVITGYLQSYHTGSGIIYNEYKTGIIVCDDDINYLSYFSNGASGENYDSFETGGLQLISGNPIFSLYENNFLEVYNNISPEGQAPFYEKSGIIQTGQIVSDSCYMINVITGFDSEYVEIVTSTGIPMYFQSGISGVIYSGNNLTTSGDLTGYYIQESTFQITGANYSNLYYNSLSYMGLRNTNDFIDIISGNDVYKNSTKILNYNTLKTYSNHVDGQTFFINTLDYNSDKIKLYLNGVAIRNGSGQNSIITEDSIEKNIFNIEKDYFITGYQIVFSELFFTGDDQTNNLHAILDYASTDLSKKELKIDNIDLYNSGVFTELNLSGSDVYFNGIKIYENNDYEIINNKFAPKEELTKISGIYFSWEKPSGSIYNTGSGIYDIYTDQINSFKKDSCIVFINGIRKSQEEFIYHDIGTDLISGVSIYLENGDITFYGEMEI